MPELPVSMWEFCKRVIREPLVLVLSIIWTILADLDGVAERVLKPHVSVEHWHWLEKHMISQSWSFSVWLTGIFLLLLFAIVKTSYGLYSQARLKMVEAVTDLENYKTPKLELSWIPTESPYRWWDQSQKPPALYFGFGVKNVSGVTIHNVKIELQKVEPEPDSSYTPCPLRLRHNILPQNAPIREFSLNPGEERIAQLMIQAESINFFWMLTAIDTIPDWKIPIRQYRFYVRVYSSAPGPEAGGTYELYKDGNLWNMKEILP